MALPAGKRNRRITFQRATVGRNALGQATKTWADLATQPGDWAFVRPVRGSESFSDGQLQGRIDVVFNVRYRADITESDRVLLDGEPYEITSPPIDINGAKTDMELNCTKGIRDGR